MNDMHPVDLDEFSENADIARANERQQQHITKQALRDLGLLPRVVGGIEYYDPTDILEAMQTLKQKNMESR